MYVKIMEFVEEYNRVKKLPKELDRTLEIHPDILKRIYYIVNHSKHLFEIDENIDNICTHISENDNLRCKYFRLNDYIYLENILNDHISIAVRNCTKIHCQFVHFKIPIQYLFKKGGVNPNKIKSNTSYRMSPGMYRNGGKI